ncbi:hypothetical protein PSTG_17230 [Puccinia striiformis f. sp. tritici PST-78]|uniref:Uncharacterized protein n=1 Tax=Puccinia striiformis f. sp. tritici PST-78 TaxID=1165861 RepID=A0A0L0URB4_9BASI|nr:hypothetical protein PSTG_17230 [Puccinia striiformis f. sp. tritici PST-78]
MLLTEMLMGFCVLHHYMEPIAVAAPVEGAQPLVDVAVGDHGHGLSMPADPPLFGIKDASGTLGQSGQTVVKDSHDAEASAVVKPTVPQTSTGGSPGQEPLLKCVGHVEADAKHFAREWLSTPVKVTFYEKGINFENVPTSISFTQFCEDPELYGFTEDEKEKVITELMARPGGNEIIRMSKGEGEGSTQSAHPSPYHINDQQVVYTPGDKRFHKNVHSIGFKDRGVTFTTFSTSHKTDKQPISVA